MKKNTAPVGVQANPRFCRPQLNSPKGKGHYSNYRKENGSIVRPKSRPAGKMMKNMFSKTVVTAMCLYTATKWAKKHIRAGVIIGSPNITSAEIKELIEKRMEGNAEYRSAGDKSDNGSMHETKRHAYFPNGTTRIADSSLARTKVSDVYLPGTVKEIDFRAFYRCKDLKHIDLPDGLEKIGEDAFNGSGLTEIDVPDSVTEIGEWAFAMCHDLKKAVLPARFANLPKHIFDSCDNLEIIIFRGTEADGH